MEGFASEPNLTPRDDGETLRAASEGGSRHSSLTSTDQGAVENVMRQAKEAAKEVRLPPHKQPVLLMAAALSTHARLAERNSAASRH